MRWGLPFLPAHALDMHSTLVVTPFMYMTSTNINPAIMEETFVKLKDFPIDLRAFKNRYHRDSAEDRIKPIPANWIEMFLSAPLWGRTPDPRFKTERTFGGETWIRWKVCSKVAGYALGRGWYNIGGLCSARCPRKAYKRLHSFVRIVWWQIRL